MTAAVELAERVGVRAACTALAVKRPTYYRLNRGTPLRRPGELHFASRRNCAIPAGSAA
jgi:hypothetical protein